MLLSNNTTSTIELKSDATFYLLYDIILALLVTIVTLSNSVVVATYCYVKNIRSKPTNLLLCNQALVDIFNGVIAGGITLLDTHTPKLITQGIYQFAIALSLHTVVFISIERYLFIFKPLFYRCWVTIPRMSVAIVGSWLLSIVWIPAPLVHYVDESTLNWDSFCWYVAVSDAIIFSLMVVVGCLHWITYQKVKCHIRQRENTQCKPFAINSKKHSHHEHCRLSEEQRAQDRQIQLRALRIFIAMFVAFLVSWIPLFVTGVLYIKDGYHQTLKEKYKYYSLDLLFYFTNSIFNPMLTLCCKKGYKNVALKLKPIPFAYTGFFWVISFN